MRLRADDGLNGRDSRPVRDVLFTPGAAGRGAFWQPVADRVPAGWSRRLLDLPGLGATPAEPSVGSYDDLVTHVARQITRPTVLVGQSMGGYLAMKVALRQPALVTHLVRAVAAGGLEMAALGASDWRPGYGDEYPQAAAWATMPVQDLSRDLPGLHVPTLLVWATADPISPLAVAHRLTALVPTTSLVTFDSDDHWVARAFAAETAAALERFVTTGEP